MVLKSCRPNFLSFRCVEDEADYQIPEDEYASCAMACSGSGEDEQMPLAQAQVWYEDEWKLQKKKAGMIKSVYLQNFMGHRELHIDLCRNVNIISETGSASTVFTAINVCFGATASQLGVVNHLRDLVKSPAENKNSGPATIGRVCVTIENEGDEGYERDVYGDEISIERYLSSRGGCYGFKLLDIDGVEQSRSKNELFSLLSFLNIGINNFAAILKQARAKRVGQPKDMYRFFTSATKMDVVADTYNSVAEEIERYQAARDQLTVSLREKEKMVAKLGKEWEREREKLLGSLFRSTESINRSVVDVNEAYSEAVTVSYLLCS